MPPLFLLSTLLDCPLSQWLRSTWLRADLNAVTDTVPSELAATYASLILADEGVEITVRILRQHPSPATCVCSRHSGGGLDKGLPCVHERELT